VQAHEGVGIVPVTPGPVPPVYQHHVGVGVGDQRVGERQPGRSPPRRSGNRCRSCSRPCPFLGAGHGSAGARRHPGTAAAIAANRGSRLRAGAGALSVCRFVSWSACLWCDVLVHVEQVAGVVGSLGLN
jgi:hypothetical protein